MRKTLQLGLLVMLLACGPKNLITVHYDENTDVSDQNLLEVLKRVESGKTEQTDFRVRIQKPHTNTTYRTLSVVQENEHYQLLILDGESGELLNSYKLDRKYIQNDTIPPGIIKRIIPNP